MLFRSDVAAQVNAAVGYIMQSPQEIEKSQRAAMRSGLAGNKAYYDADMAILRAHKQLEAAQKSGNAEAIAGAE